MVGGIPGARWVPSENFHVTLRFIGEVAKHEAEEVDLALAAIRGKPFAMSVAGVGTFAKAGRETTLWAGIERNPALDHLQSKIEISLQRAGFAPERRRFTPHVTLARLNNADPVKLAGFVQARTPVPRRPRRGGALHPCSARSSARRRRSIRPRSNTRSACPSSVADVATAFFLTHPDVVIDPLIPVPDWPLSPRGAARVRTALSRPWLAGVRAIQSSTERKAVDTALILSGGLGIEFGTIAALGENDRSSTGYLPREEFERVADAFFAEPEISIRGWERAIDAQRRIVAAVDAALAAARPPGDLAIVSHGAVGALLLCALEGLPISRGEDQPAGAGGNYYAFDTATRLLRHGWLPIDG